jgi:hypothetical protein
MEGQTMFDRSKDLGDQIAEAVQGSLTNEERAFATLPDGELHGRYALELFIDLVSASAFGSEANRG